MERVAIIARLKDGTETRAAELIAEGPPFDFTATGITCHDVYLSAGEVVFVFEGHEVEWTLDDLVDKQPHQLGLAFDRWRAIVDGPPRIARARFAWERHENESADAPHATSRSETWA